MLFSPHFCFYIWIKSNPKTENEIVYAHKHSRGVKWSPFLQKRPLSVYMCCYTGRKKGKFCPLHGKFALLNCKILNCVMLFYLNICVPFAFELFLVRWPKASWYVSQTAILTHKHNTMQTLWKIYSSTSNPREHLAFSGPVSSYGSHLSRPS